MVVQAAVPVVAQVEQPVRALVVLAGEVQVQAVLAPPLRPDDNGDRAFGTRRLSRHC